MRTRIQTLPDIPVVIATWPAEFDDPVQEIQEVHYELRQVFVQQGWDNAMIIHDITLIELDFGTMVMMLSEMKSEDSAYLAERATVRMVGPDEIAGLSVAANRQEQYTGGSRTAAQAESVEAAIAEARTLFGSSVDSPT
ncbi:MAG: hypothetical protein ACFB51_00985 [Anaerolineae bacterium]